MHEKQVSALALADLENHTQSDVDEINEQFNTIIHIQKTMKMVRRKI